MDLTQSIEDLLGTNICTRPRDSATEKEYTQEHGLLQIAFFCFCTSVKTLEIGHDEHRILRM